MDSKKIKISFFSSKTYVKNLFTEIHQKNFSTHDFEMNFFNEELNSKSAMLAIDAEVACTFVNDNLDKETLEQLKKNGVKTIALRCAGFNNCDLETAHNLGLKLVRVPAYSPYAVAEHAIALLLTLNRKIHKAYNRVKEDNFSLDGLMGFDLHGKTMGIIGTGKIGICLAKICVGFGMKVLGYDPYKNKEFVEIGGEYKELDEIFQTCDVISLHVPLFAETKYMINEESIKKMKKGIYIINTGRGALINTKDAIKGLKSGHIGGLCLDVYEMEEQYFFKDCSAEIMQDDVLARLMTFQNVIITGHQAFLTKEAVMNIATTTLQNLVDIKEKGKCSNEIEFVKK